MFWMGYLRTTEGKWLAAGLVRLLASVVRAIGNDQYTSVHTTYIFITRFYS